MIRKAPKQEKRFSVCADEAILGIKEALVTTLKANHQKRKTDDHKIESMLQSIEVLNTGKTKDPYDITTGDQEHPFYLEKETKKRGRMTVSIDLYDGINRQNADNVFRMVNFLSSRPIKSSSKLGKYVEVHLQELVDAGLFSHVENARKALGPKGSISHALTGLYYQDARSVGHPWYRVEIKENFLYVSLDPSIQWLEWKKSFYSMPPYFFEVDWKASEILWYFGFLGKQAGNRKQKKEIDNGGWFGVSYFSLAKRLGLHPRRNIPCEWNRVIQRINGLFDEIEEAQRKALDEGRMKEPDFYLELPDEDDLPAKPQDAIVRIKFAGVWEQKANEISKQTAESVQKKKRSIRKQINRLNEAKGLK